MKFLIVTHYGSYVIEAEDFAQAADHAYDDHSGYAHVEAIIKLPVTDSDE